MGHAGVMQGVVEGTVKVRTVQELGRVPSKFIASFNQPSPRDEDLGGPYPAPAAALSVLGRGAARTGP